MLKAISKSQSIYLASQTSEVKKELGQFFTGSTIADYMASMIKFIDAPIVRILDAGAGAGILTSSAVLKCLELGNMNVQATLYEIDKSILPLLEGNMQNLVSVFAREGGKFSYKIHNRDFVLVRPDKEGSHFHLSVINPPYFKYSSKTSPYSGATKDLYKGNPNIYASFMAVVSACMLPTGQMIVIVPRSFTNGLYFKGFRRYLNLKMNLSKIHIFKSRSKVFNKLSVLQENIICHYIKEEQKETVEVVSSNDNTDLKQAETTTYKASLIIDKTNDHEIIRIPENAEEGGILDTVANWKNSFCDNGYYISTGPVVMHRTRDYITSSKDTRNTVPLMCMHNIKGLKADWTGRHKKDSRFKLVNDFDKHTTKNSVYVILKRFTSKDEKKRLVTGVYDGTTKKTSLVALENHLNYIGRVGEDMSIVEAYGLAVLFNSSFMDKYFRCISGNTQVNATEVRLMKIPEQKSILSIGQGFMKSSSIKQESIDELVKINLNV